ncbi:hypothetical protein TNCV_3192351 [Trichonephila clavipes]|nr:hypothetical protein TNCV_3192351 [Trichonephila clavipes]
MFLCIVCTAAEDSKAHEWKEITKRPEFRTSFQKSEETLLRSVLFFFSNFVTAVVSPSDLFSGSLESFVTVLIFNTSKQIGEYLSVKR